MKKKFASLVMVMSTALLLANNDYPKQNEKTKENSLKTEKTLKKDLIKVKTIIQVNKSAAANTSHCWAMSIPMPLGGPTWIGCLTPVNQ